MQDLLTQLLWVADERQLVSNPRRAARGTVIEAHLDRKRGAVATLLVQVGGIPAAWPTLAAATKACTLRCRRPQAGTLRPGDVVRAGASYGRARTLQNDLGRSMGEAGPSIAVQLVGLNSVPAAGEEFEVCATEQAARLAALEFEEQLKVGRAALTWRAWRGRGGVRLW